MTFHDDALNARNRNVRHQLLAIYQAAIQAVNGRQCAVEALNRQPMNTACRVIAIGKAASSMLQGAREALGDRMDQALLITKQGHLGPVINDPRVRYFEAGHPTPNDQSLQAGQALLTFIANSPARTPLLFLISGGSSALVEVLPEGMNLEKLIAVNEWLLASGWDIHRMNRVRKALSCIKGGRLAAFLDGRPARVLAISDVPGDALGSIGSGLLAPDPQPLDGALQSQLPDWIQSLVGQSPRPPSIDSPSFQTVESQIVASNAIARQAAATKAKSLGMVVYAHNGLLTGDALEAGRRLADELIQGEPGLHIWGGETTVTLPAHPGRGGRCQAMALAAAQVLSAHAACLFLAAGTDGTDGPGDDAGALVDGESLRRGQREGFDAQACLSAADSGSFLDAAGDLINTGPTGTNVMDLVLAYKPDAHAD